MTVTPRHGNDGDDTDDGYAGPAELLIDDRTVPVEVRLGGHFDPVSGHYRWYGRVSASPEVADLLAGGNRRVRLRTPHAEVATSLSDVDPWGRPRVEGFGASPFPVPTAIGDDGRTG